MCLTHTQILQMIIAISEEVDRFRCEWSKQGEELNRLEDEVHNLLLWKEGFPVDPPYESPDEEE